MVVHRRNLIATDQRFTGGGRQRELVADTIRGSVLFIYRLFLSPSSGIYTEADWIEVNPYSTVENCDVIIFYNEKCKK